MGDELGAGEDYTAQQPTESQDPHAGAYELAGWGVRLGAYLIDGLIVGAVNRLLGMMVMPQMMTGASWFGGSAQEMPEPGTVLALQGLNMLIAVIYFVGFWTVKNGQTPGKMALGIRIIGKDGNPIGVGKAFLRYIGYILSTIPCLLGFFWPLWDDENRAWHDMIAGTRVIVK